MFSFDLSCNLSSRSYIAMVNKPENVHEISGLICQNDLISIDRCEMALARDMSFLMGLIHQHNSKRDVLTIRERISNNGRSNP